MTMERKRGIHFGHALLFLGATAAIGFAGSALQLSSPTVLWLIFGAVVAMGLGLIEQQEIRLGKIIELLERIRAEASDEALRHNLKGLQGKPEEG